MQMLKRLQQVQLPLSGGTCEVEQFLGGGGQGEVYRASLAGQLLALKWYHPAAATPQQRIALETLMKKGPPSDHFLWPLEMALIEGQAGFGYVMPLREPCFKGIVDLVKRQAEPTFRALATAGLNLSHGFKQLHAKGLCYRDISFGNVFFDPTNGDVLICDNDNVAVDGRDQAGVLGTPRFMAPEIVRGEALPSTQTDLYSLAVLLFYIFMIHHPLDGKCEAMIRSMDLPAMNRLYGTDALFVFDPDDDSNRPVPGLHDNALIYWPLYPGFMRTLFSRTFTDGIRDPQNGRVREGEWRAAMVALRDCIVDCGRCAAENFCDLDALTAGSAQACWSCRKPLVLPCWLQVGKQRVMLNHDACLFAHHVDDQREYDFSEPVAQVARHPTQPNLWGLKNLGSEKWVTIMPDGQMKDVLPDRSVRIDHGIKVQFGKTEGLIERNSKAT